MNRTILIAGATGFIGSYLVESLLEEDYNVIILKRSFDSVSRIKKFANKYKHYDTDKAGLDIVFAENNIDFVINLVTDFGRSSTSKPSEVLETNIIYGLKLIEASVTGRVKYFFNIDSSLNPKVSLYAHSKRLFREIIKKYFSSKIKIMNLKLEHVYGENDDLFKFIPMAISKLKKNEPLDMSMGDQQLDLIYVRDCISAFKYLIKNVDKYKKQFNIFEIGTGKTIPLNQFILKIKKKLQSKSKINFGALQYRQDEQMYSRANLSTIKGWKPKYSIDEGINQIIK